MDSKIKVTAHVLGYNESRILAYTFRHYQSFCSRVVLHDLGSSDGSRELAAKMGVEVRQWDCKGVTDDILNAHIKNSCWQDGTADWIICADADELIYFPERTESVFNEYEKQQLPVVKPHGWEMFSDTFPTTTGQIYDEVRFGARDDHWYAKPILFSRKRVAKSEIGMGAHEAIFILNDGSKIEIKMDNLQSLPPCYLLHFHHIRPLKEVGEDYEAHINRQGAMNKKMGWGIQYDGMQHAKDKRNYITARLERVIS